jgi:TolA-binding protein
MKRTERQRLKQDELTLFTRHARETLEERRRELTWIVVAVVVIAAGALGYLGWRNHQQGRANMLLADALAVEQARVGPPADATGAPGLAFPTEHDRAQAAAQKFKAVADAFPSTDDGIFSRYQEASNLVAVGDLSGAARAYQQVIDRAGEGIYGQMARLGLAEVQARNGQYEQAITGLKALAQRKDGPLPIDGILMQLGLAYRDAGRTADAQQTFNRLIDEFPDSPFNGDAKRERDALNKA